MNNIQKTLETLYLDYINNFLTIERFSEYYGISEQLAKQIIKEVENEYIYNQPKNNNTMKTYLINSFHIATEDNFEHGEVGDSNFWDMKGTKIVALNPKDAIAKYFEDTLCLPFNIEFLEEQEDDCIRYYNLVDNDNQEPTEYEIELWREGKKKLYSLDTTIEIYELKQITEI